MEISSGYSNSDRCSESADCTKLKSTVYIQVYSSWNMYRRKDDPVKRSDSREKQRGPERGAFQPFCLSRKDTDCYEHIIPI